MKTVGASDLHFATGQADDAFLLIKKYHYSHRIPGSVQLVGTFHVAGGLFGNLGNAVAAVCFSSPPTRWSEPVWELSRLVRTEESQLPLSRLIAMACHHIKALRTIDLLVSFADAQQGHHGGIYQACSWHYHGQRQRSMDGLTINGRFVPGRTCNATLGTRSPALVLEQHPQWKVEPHYDIGKHLYWKALWKTGEAKAQRLHLLKRAYPKPAMHATEEAIA